MFATKVATAAKTTTFRSAVYQIRSKIKDVSYGVHIYSFNVPEDQLESAHALLDKEQGRRAFRVTYNFDHNFVIRHMPGRVHEETIQNWNYAFAHALNGLTSTPPGPGTPGCEPIGSTTFDLGPRKKQPDGGVRPTGSDYPTVVLEVGSSESLIQLSIDARLWLEHTNYVNLVILISIDPPLPPSTTPQITIQLWRPAARPGSHARQRIAQVVQNDDWTQNETPLRIALAEIFGVQIPAVYGGHMHVNLDTHWLRQKIIDSYP